MYFVGLPEQEKMVYATRVEALRYWFRQETDTSIALQELAGLRRGKNQLAKELADSARRLASRAYHSNDYASQEKALLHAFQTAMGEDLQLKCAERSCRTLEMAVETVEIQERYTKKAVRALKQEGSEIALYLKAMGEKLEALMGEIKDDRKQQNQWAAGDRRRTWNVTRATKKETSQGSVRLTQPKDARETQTEETVMVGNRLYLPGQIEGNRVTFLVDTRSGVSILAARTWKK